MPDGNSIVIGQANTASNPGNETSLSRNEVTNQTVFVARNLNVGEGGIRGEAPNGFGVSGTSINGPGVRGSSDTVVGVEGFSSQLAGVTGTCNNGFGVLGSSDTGVGVEGISTSDFGVRGRSDISVGVFGTSNSSFGVRGNSSSGSGLVGQSSSSFGVVGVTGDAENSEGGFFVGGVTVWTGGLTVANGSLTVLNGAKNFKIDHPLDPENRYLLHTCIESSEMKNVYDGVTRLDEDGAAWVDLPEWFEALNGDFRYQLTAVGSSAPNLHVAEEVSENRFKIAGGEEGMKVCWQVTGTRKDPWAAANPLEVEQEKPEEERGRYLEPSLYDAPEEQRVMIGPLAEAVEEEQRPPEPSGIDFARLEEEHRRQINELRQHEEAPPEST